MTRWHDTLLPGDLRDGDAGRRSARDWLVDVAMWLIAAAIGLAAFAPTASHHGPALGLLDFGLGVVALVALWWRRSRPGAVGALAAGASIVSAWAGGAAVIAGFNVALRGARREILVFVGLTAVSAVAFPLIYAQGFVENVVIGVLLTAAVIGWGLLVRVRREQLLALRERAARQARDAERRRIAREMHDVLAHHVSLLSLQAGALEFRPDAPPEEIAGAAGVIRASARTALEELRQVIGLLREGADPAAPEPPQPALADIPRLVADCRAAGMRVDCEIDVPDPGRVPAALARTAYRVVQEGLTNARKHAPDSAVAVAVTGGAQLVVEVVTRGPVGVAAAAPLPGAGSGLIGLEERVVLAGGALRHGPDAAGDFVLRATLPCG